MRPLRDPNRRILAGPGRHINTDKPDVAAETAGVAEVGEAADLGEAGEADKVSEVDATGYPNEISSRSVAPLPALLEQTAAEPESHLPTSEPADVPPHRLPPQSSAPTDKHR